MSSSVNQPLDLIRLSLDEEVVVKCRNDREIRGRLIAFDQHLNLVVSNAKEIHTIVTKETETAVASSRNEVRDFEILFVRGDTVTLISPMVRT